jgi:hypothetical protein
MKRLLLLAGFAVTCLALAQPAPAAVASFHGAATIGTRDSFELVRRRRHGDDYREETRRGRGGVPLFVVPGLYWGPAWWQADSGRRDRSRRQCNWLFAC